MSSLDRVDLELLNALADDHRATVVALADRLGLSRNTVQARMLRLERAGVFHSYERAMSTKALGLPIEAMVSVMVRQADLPRITTAIAEIPEVVQAHGMSGQVDLLVRVVARDTQHLFDVDARILAIEGVERTETSLVMGEVIGYRVRPLLEASASPSGLRGEHRAEHPADPRGEVRRES
ncbi:Lrp/AsnC family transcriptional regulator [Microbacterium flavum]|uniref:Lrp/AsnC family transcriptional regulator n=1 Tax=Microbacterium flavum TaxID=415216 RepID=A0ABS5XVG4_9MICO|nr:Lrp/AsnC family transcriptional regulator [Microbacterium flavum]MBT8798538.1 Lrp/AsnC family transcriptional regulator [Microbacterium flavum]